MANGNSRENLAQLFRACSGPPGRLFDQKFCSVMHYGTIRKHFGTIRTIKKVLQYEKKGPSCDGLVIHWQSGFQVDRPGPGRALRRRPEASARLTPADSTRTVTESARAQAALTQ